MEKTELEKASEMRRAYAREWRRKNKEKVRQYNISFWIKKAAQNEKRNECR